MQNWLLFLIEMNLRLLYLRGQLIYFPKDFVTPVEKENRDNFWYSNKLCVQGRIKYSVNTVISRL